MKVAAVSQRKTENIFISYDYHSWPSCRGLKVAQQHTYYQDCRLDVLSEVRQSHLLMHQNLMSTSKY